MLPRCFLDFSVGVGAFVIGLSQVSSFLLLYIVNWPSYIHAFKLLKFFMRNINQYNFYTSHY